MADIQVEDADYSKMVTTINRNMFGSWYASESMFTTDTLRVYTSNITSDNTMTHYRTEGMPDAQGYALIELEDFDGAIQAGEDYIGTVREVYTEDGFDIPDECIVLGRATPETPRALRRWKRARRSGSPATCTPAAAPRTRTASWMTGARSAMT